MLPTPLELPDKPGTKIVISATVEDIRLSDAVGGLMLTLDTKTYGLKTVDLPNVLRQSTDLIPYQLGWLKQNITYTYQAGLGEKNPIMSTIPLIFLHEIQLLSGPLKGCSYAMRSCISDSERYFARR